VARHETACGPYRTPGTPAKTCWPRPARVRRRTDFRSSGRNRAAAGV